MEGAINRKQVSVELAENGYVQTNYFVSENELTKLEKLYVEVAEPAVGFHTSFHLGSSEVKKEVNNALKSVVQSIVASLIPSYKIVVANFAVKEAGIGSQLPLHRDWSVVDEKANRGYNVWFSLVDLNDENGVIGFCKGTQKNAYLFRSPSKSETLHQVNEDTLEEVEYVHLKRGQVVIFDHGTIHCSKPNMTSNSRVAVTSVIIPKEQDAIHYYHTKDESGNAVLEKFVVDESFFFQYKLNEPLPMETMKMVKKKSFFSTLLKLIKWSN